MIKRLSGRLLLYGLLLSTLAILLRTIALEQQNTTLYASGEWESAKLEPGRAVMGSISFMITRTALYRGRLDLSAWHGWQSVIYRRAVRPAELTFRFALDEGGALSAVLAQNHAGATIVRIEHRESPARIECITSDRDGRFRSRDELAQSSAIAPLEWHSLDLRTIEGEVAVALDGQDLGRCALHSDELGHVGFRAQGNRAVWVDDVRLVDSDGAVVLEETFDNLRLSLWTEPFGRRSLAIAFLASLGLAGLAYGLARWRGASGTRADFTVISTLAVAVFAAGGFYLVDHFHLSSLHPSSVDYTGFGFVRMSESTHGVRLRLRQHHPPGKPAGRRRILFVGSSQTWGTGAPRPEVAFANRLETLLQAEAPEADIEVINAGISGEKAANLLDYYINEWIRWEPDTVVINLSNNDGPAFVEPLRHFAEQNRELGIRTVFIPEANSRRSHKLWQLLPKHELVREVAARTGSPVIELHQPLIDRADTGFLWWDHIHMSGYGHELAAQLLFESRSVLLPDVFPEVGARGAGEGVQ